MKKYFYRTNFSFLCTPIDIDKLFMIFYLIFCCVRVFWCQMPVYTLLTGNGRCMDSVPRSTRDVKLFQESRKVIEETQLCTDMLKITKEAKQRERAALVLGTIGSKFFSRSHILNTDVTNSYAGTNNN